ncbi:MAG TPA: histidine phosphatase family protein [Ktedonobacteraceae bacterium]|nr:histidine phosphatase family protein [Ktedonobacteraceae bacterium]
MGNMSHVNQKTETLLIIMRAYLKKYISNGFGWMHILWIYLQVSQRFWRWRIQLWLKQLHRTESTQTGMKQTLLFIRHGQTTWNAEHILPGQLPGIALNDTGREQAERLADALALIPISAIISSPLERARDTAEIIKLDRKLTIELEPDLMDTDIGRWSGQKYDELAKIDPAWKAYVTDPTVAPEGIETFPHVQQRAMAAVERWRARETIGAYPAFVAHADVVKLLVAHYTGLEAGKAGKLFIDNASVSIVEIDSEHLQQARVIAVGWSPHPGWLKPAILEAKQDREESSLNENAVQKT